MRAAGLRERNTEDAEYRIEIRGIKMSHEKFSVYTVVLSVPFHFSVIKKNPRRFGGPSYLTKFPN
jgi:hypothetical protein